ncbi:MAG: hypothetical protein ACFFG0_03830 [Candidatus Thorarchaeota archaeon]
MEDNYVDFLKEDYQDYITTVTTQEMAASLECSSFLLYLCDKISPRAVADFGSGFSSFALRKYRKHTGKLFTLKSIDTDKEWLKKTSHFIKRKGMVDSNLILFKEFIEDLPIQFDLILFDIAYYQDGTRQNILPMVLNNCVNENTNILFDDMQINHYFMFVLEKMFGLNFNMINTRHHTIDNFGRFSILFNNLKNIEIKK